MKLKHVLLFLFALVIGIALMPPSAKAQVAITSPLTLPEAAVGVSYTPYQLTATGCPGGLSTACNWSVLSLTPVGSGTGLSLSSSGLLSGTPVIFGPYTGVFTLTIKADDGGANSDTKTFTLNSLGITTTSPLPAGTVGAPYNQSLTALGNTGLVTWTVTLGSLPTGLSLNAVTGAISGTPSVAGPSSFTVSANDVTVTTSQAFSLTINVPPLVINTTSPLPLGVVNLSYSTTITASGGTPPYTWAASGTALPTGLTLGAGTGTISGLPTVAASTAGIIITVTDAASATATRTFSLTINAAALPLAIDHTLLDGTVLTCGPPCVLPAGKVSVGYLETLTASGGTAPYTWSVGAGMPAGVTLGAGGRISGVPTIPAAHNFFTVTVNDNVGGSATLALDLPIINLLTITMGTPLPTGIVGMDYVALNGDMATTLTANLGNAACVACTWGPVGSIGGSGLSLAATGAITGSTLVVGTYQFTATVTDPASGQTASRLFTVSVVKLQSLAIITQGNIQVTPGTYTTGAPLATLVAGGSTPAYSFILNPGAPGWMQIEQATGKLWGTTPGAAAPEVDNITVTVIDSGKTTVADCELAPPCQHVTQPFTIIVSDLAITTPGGALAAGTVGTAYVPSPGTLAYIATTAKLPYAWSISAHSLPTGLSLSSGGVISGTPVTPGTFNFDATVTDNLDPADGIGASATESYSITVSDAAVDLTIFTAAGLPAGTVGSPYSQYVIVGGGGPPYTWAVTAGSLPAGLVLDSVTGLISGTPTSTVSPGFTVTVTDAGGSAPVSKAFTLTISAAPALSITTATPLTPVAVTGQGYSKSLTATGGAPLFTSDGTPIYTWSISAGSLPTGLNLATADGRILGTPPLSAIGTSSFTVQVADSLGTPATKSFTLAVESNTLVITTAQSLPDATTGNAYTQTLAESCHTCTGTITWSLASGSPALPGGLTLHPLTGVIDGTPLAPPVSPTTYLFTIKVTDAGGTSQVATKSFQLIVH